MNATRKQPKAKVKTFQVVVTVRSIEGTRPITRVLGGDTIFVYLLEGQTARFATKLVKPAKTQA